MRPNSRSSSFERSSSSARQHQPAPRRPGRRGGRRAAMRRRARAAGSAAPTACPAAPAAAPPPSGVGISTRAPSAASCTATGTTMCRSSPSRRKSGCGADVHGDVQVAGIAATQAGVALARHAHPVAVGDAGRHPHRHRLRARLLAESAARLARPRPLLAAATARDAAAREHHVTAHGAHAAGALARRAGAATHPACGRCRRRRDTFRGASPRRRGRRRRTPRRTSTRHPGAGRRRARRRAACSAALAQHFGEQVAEGRRVIDAARREIESLEPAAHARLRRSPSPAPAS